MKSESASTQPDKLRALAAVEFLIALLILLWLAMIAAPNIERHNVASKVARTKADLLRVARAIEAYRIDVGAYPQYPDPAYANLPGCPFGSCDEDVVAAWRGYVPSALTTPIAYLHTVPVDAFQPANPAAPGSPAAISLKNPLGLLQYEFRDSPSAASRWFRTTPPGVNCLLLGVGPDLTTYISSSGFHNNATEYLQTRSGALGLFGFYDPTNGVISGGDIIYHGPIPGFGPQVRYQYQD